MHIIFYKTYVFEKFNLRRNCLLVTITIINERVRKESLLKDPFAVRAVRTANP